jgi:hypothetical protein
VVIEWSEVGVVEVTKVDVKLGEADSAKLCGTGAADMTGTGANVVKCAGDGQFVVGVAAAKCCASKCCQTSHGVAEIEAEDT